MKYRAEIDGLRALAVVPVILFHAGVPGFGGGFVGVDVFFVISGYLITTIILVAMQAQRFRLRDFYERRARRILPALFLVVTATGVGAVIWMMPSQLKDFAQSVVAVNVFASNVLFWLEDGYFDFESEEKPLLHTWSLAVEEQFYVVFPLLLLLLVRRRTWILPVLIVCAVVSFGAGAWAARVAPAAAFYLAPFRFWELLAGSICAVVLLQSGPRKNNTLGLLGLALICLSVAFIDEADPFPSEYTVPAVLGTALVILYAGSGSLPAQLLSFRPIVGIGLISYSAYLWHQPLFAFARIRLNEEPGGLEIAILVAATFVLAILTWKYVEQPFRSGARPLLPRQAHVFGASAAVAVVISGAGLYVVSKNGFSDSFDSVNTAGYRWDNMQLQTESWSLLPTTTNARAPTDSKADDTLWFTLDGRQTLLLVGNSHSKDLYNAMVHSASVTDVYQVARYGVQLHELAAEHRMYDAPNYAAADYVIVATYYSDDDIRALPTVLDRLARDGKRVVLVSMSPIFSGGQVVTPADDIVLPELMFETGRPHPSIADEVNRQYWADLTLSPRQQTVARINEALRRLSEEREIPLLDRLDYLCSDAEQRCFAMANDLTKHFYDESHTTLAGARFFGKRMDALDWFRPDFSAQ
ncbi:MAG: acyltransferase family protein [Pseudomonadota bacterium]